MHVIVVAKSGDALYHVRSQTAIYTFKSDIDLRIKKTHFTTDTLYCPC